MEPVIRDATSNSISSAHAVPVVGDLVRSPRVVDNPQHLIERNRGHRPMRNNRDYNSSGILTDRPRRV
jgi:hypothetical protein